MTPLCLSPGQPGGFSSVFPSEGVISGSFGRSLWCRDPAAVTHHPQKFINSLDGLEDPGDLEALAPPDRYRMATYLLSYLEEVLRTLAKTLPGPSFTHLSPLDTGEASSCPAPALAPSCIWIPQSLPFSPQSCPWRSRSNGMEPSPWARAMHE